MIENSSDKETGKLPTQREGRQPSWLTEEKYARLKAEAIAPYRGLRKLIYTVFGASGFIGAFVFLTQALAGREVESALPNLALQVGVVALMVWLFRIDGRSRHNR